MINKSIERQDKPRDKVAPDSPSPYGLWALIGTSTRSLLILRGVFDNSNNEARVCNAALGGVIATFTAPFWVIYRGKLPLTLTTALLALWITGYCTSTE